MRIARGKTHEYHPKQELARPAHSPNFAAPPEWLRSGNGSARAPPRRAARLGAWLQPCRAGPPARRETSAQSRSSRAAASKLAAPQTSPVPGTAARGGLGQVPGLHNKERAGDTNPLTSANSPRSLPPPADPETIWDLWYLERNEDGSGWESHPFLQTPFAEFVPDSHPTAAMLPTCRTSRVKTKSMYNPFPRAAAR